MLPSDQPMLFMVLMIQTGVPSAQTALALLVAAGLQKQAGKMSALAPHHQGKGRRSAYKYSAPSFFLGCMGVIGHFKGLSCTCRVWSGPLKVF